MTIELPGQVDSKVSLEDVRQERGGKDAKRPYQEDRAVSAYLDIQGIPNARGRLMAVMDGYGGSLASQYVKETFENF